MEKKAQLKIQQMAFVLVALVIFMGMVGIIFFSVYVSDIRKDASELRDKEARELVRKISSSPEFVFSAQSCVSCVDFIKVLKLKDLAEYKNFWKLDYLIVERINNKSSSELIECTLTNIDNCDKISVIGKENFGSAKSSFVTLVRWDESLGGGNYRYELGRIKVSEIDIKND